MQLKSIYIPFLIGAILFGGVFVSKSLGIWRTESSKIPQTIATGTYAGEYDPADIRGSYTFGDITNSFGITSEILATAFNIITDSPEEFQVKSLEDIYSHLEVEVGTDSVRRFTALYTGLPYETEEVLPVQAIELLSNLGKISESVKSQLLNNSILLPSSSDIPKTTAEDSEPLINGKTTVDDIISHGISIEELEGLTGLTIETQSITIRELCQEQQVSFSTVKDSLNGLLRE